MLQNEKNQIFLSSDDFGKIYSYIAYVHGLRHDLMDMSILSWKTIDDISIMVSYHEYEPDYETYSKDYHELLIPLSLLEMNGEEIKDLAQYYKNALRIKELLQKKNKYTELEQLRQKAIKLKDDPLFKKEARDLEIKYEDHLYHFNNITKTLNALQDAQQQLKAQIDSSRLIRASKKYKLLM